MEGEQENTGWKFRKWLEGVAERRGQCPDYVNRNRVRNQRRKHIWRKWAEENGKLLND